MVSDFTTIPVQPNKAIVGKNAFAHEAGIHQHGIIANRKVYEIMNPKTIGKKTELIIGKHSGRAAVGRFLKSNGFNPKADELLQITNKIKELADKKKRIYNEDIIAIAESLMKNTVPQKIYVTLDEVQISTGTKITPTAVVRLTQNGVEITGTASGVGPVDAVSKAIKQALMSQFELREYSLKAITGGTDALANVSITIDDKSGNTFSGEDLGGDITMVSAKALVKCINKLLEHNSRKGTR